MQLMYLKGFMVGYLIWIMDYVFRFMYFGWMLCFYGDFFLEKFRVVFINCIFKGK